MMHATKIVTIHLGACKIFMKTELGGSQEMAVMVD